jgi:hypothetical protein
MRATKLTGVSPLLLDRAGSQEEKATEKQVRGSIPVPKCLELVKLRAGLD